MVGVIGSNQIEKARAYIVKENEKLTEQEVIEFFMKNKTSSHWEIDQHVVFVNEIVRNQLGKVIRRLYSSLEFDH